MTLTAKAGWTMNLILSIALAWFMCAMQETGYTAEDRAEMDAIIEVANAQLTPEEVVFIVPRLSLSDIGE